MSIEFSKDDPYCNDFYVGDRDAETDTVTVSCGAYSEGADFTLSREEARKVWEHLDREFRFTG